MKLIGKIVLGLAFTFAALTPRDASAALICAACTYQGDATYLGSYDPTTFDLGSFASGSLGGAFDQAWLFTVDPSGVGEINANFIPTGSISGFDVQLFNVTLNGGAPGAAGSFYGNLYTPGAMIADGTTAGTQTAISPLVLNAGEYLFRITGTVNDNTAALYTGQLSTSVPEPASMTLMGLGLAACAAAIRRRRQRV